MSTPDLVSADQPSEPLDHANGVVAARRRPMPVPRSARSAVSRPVDLVKRNSGAGRGAVRFAAGMGTEGGFVGLARVAASTAWHAAGALAKGSVGGVSGLYREISAGEPIGHIVDNRVEAARSTAWRALGLDGDDAAVETGRSNSDNGHREARLRRTRSSYRDLRKRGDELLRQSADPTYQQRTDHPAFEQILDEITPDEARILRFMALAGSQPAIDVRTKTPFGVGSERIAGGLNLIAEMSGCAFPERKQQYLANLNRLGMLRFSTEHVEDPRRYSFIEAQPECAQAMAKTKKAVTIYRSIYLSLFGRQFCEVCFTLEEYDAGGWIKDVR